MNYQKISVLCVDIIIIVMLLYAAAIQIFGLKNPYSYNDLTLFAVAGVLISAHTMFHNMVDEDKHTSS